MGISADAARALPVATVQATRAISTSFAAQAQPLTEVAVEGNVEALLAEIDRVVSAESSTAKDVADAAVSLAYLQAKGDRRLWGKVFERAQATKASFDAASLSNFFWAASTANVGHFQTLAELAGPAAALLPSLTPTQLSIVVEGLGRAGVSDAQLFANVADVVVAKIGSMSAPDVARVVYGFGAANVQDGAVAKAAAKVLAERAGDLGVREAGQAVWGLARMRRADKAALDAVVRAVKGKLASADNGVDVAGLAWGLAHIGYKADADATRSLAAALKTAAPQLTPAHAIDAAWALGVLGAGDKEAVSALFNVAASAISAAPDSLSPAQVAALYEAAALTPEAKLPEQVNAFAAKMHALVDEGARSKASSGLVAFRQAVAKAAATALGARYRPEIAQAVAAFPVVTPAGVYIDIAVSLDNGAKFAIEPVCVKDLSSSGSLLGAALARAGLVASQGYKPVLVPYPEWAAVEGEQAKAAYLLTKIKAIVPAASSKVNELQRKLEQPFDAYA